MTDCLAFLAIMIPAAWFTTSIRFRPRIVSLAPSMARLKSEIDKVGGWNRMV